MSTEPLSLVGVSCERSEPEGLRAGRELATAQPHDGRADTCARRVILKSFESVSALFELYGRGEGLVDSPRFFRNSRSATELCHLVSATFRGMTQGSSRGTSGVQRGYNVLFGGGRHGA